jgi:8-oxo-dGTP pyrophosphatase MutT (NUDIX family)/lambda repressor-like predicted transcriptional regulator
MSKGTVVLNPDKVTEWFRGTGLSGAAIARKYKISPATLRKAMTRRAVRYVSGQVIADVMGTTLPSILDRPNQAPTTAALCVDHGSRCIRIKSQTVRFHLVEGILGKPSWAPAQISVERTRKPFRPSGPHAGEVLKRQRQIHHQLVRDGKPDRQITRLISFQPTASGLVLRVQPTSFSMFCATNLAIPESSALAISDHHHALREHLDRNGMGLESPYLANSLNVIYMVHTSDGFTIIPRRSPFVYESPNHWQASVGGHIDYDDAHPVTAVIREAREELGIKVLRSEIRFTGFGVNQRTGEPDLLGLVQSRLSLVELIGAFVKRAEKTEFTTFEVQRVTPEDSGGAAFSVLNKSWSQPSDQACFLQSLAVTLGVGTLSDAIDRVDHV